MESISIIIYVRYQISDIRYKIIIYILVYYYKSGILIDNLFVVKFIYAKYFIL